KYKTISALSLMAIAKAFNIKLETLLEKILPVLAKEITREFSPDQKISPTTVKIEFSTPPVKGGPDAA
ncbi:MAG: hypothetical protein HY877_09010, partial [Deltaproteobacteria bacterium]|nr:hypothetical protein [Deltaproteobacteria bacterium]